MGLPFLRIEFTGVDASVLPTERSARVVQDALDSEFPPGRSAPLYVAAETDDEAEAAPLGRARCGSCPAPTRCRSPGRRTASTGSTS